MRKSTVSREDAEVLAVKAIGYLAGDEDRLGEFLALTGLSPQELRGQIGDPAFLGAVLDYILGDERLLLEFCQSINAAPELPALARTRLPGAPVYE
jgi:hypothetical protein